MKLKAAFTVPFLTNNLSPTGMLLLPPTFPPLQVFQLFAPNDSPKPQDLSRTCGPWGRQVHWVHPPVPTPDTLRFCLPAHTSLNSHLKAYPVAWSLSCSDMYIVDLVISTASNPFPVNICCLRLYNLSFVVLHLLLSSEFLHFSGLKALLQLCSFHKPIERLSLNLFIVFLAQSSVGPFSASPFSTSCLFFFLSLCGRCVPTQAV